MFTPIIQQLLPDRELLGLRYWNNVQISKLSRCSRSAAAGLLAGVAAAVKAAAPHVKVYGVQATGAPAMYLSKHAGKWVETPEAYDC